jgi:thiamine-phosphate pyrophosphorylase
VERARDAGVDLIVFGPVFEKRVEGRVVVSGVGLEVLARASRAAGGIPVVALGGVTMEVTGDCLAAGAAGVAGIRLFRAG